MSEEKHQSLEFGRLCWSYKKFSYHIYPLEALILHKKLKNINTMLALDLTDIIFSSKQQKSYYT